MNIPKVAAIHDLSSYGRCSLSVIAPVLSSMGVQCLALPTAVLSTHTGGFTGMAICDLSDFLRQTLEHWKQTGVTCDCVYSGFLAGDNQIDIVKEYIKYYKDAMIVVDPVLGDNGHLYQTCTNELLLRMKELITHADIITPNITELCLLLDKPYSQRLSLDCAFEYLEQLSQKSGVKKIVLTGVILQEEMLSNIAYDSITKEFFVTGSKQISENYPGTGDIFTSVVVAQLVNGKTLDKAVRKAADFTSKCIEKTFEKGIEPRQGVLLESILSKETYNEQ